MTDLNTTLTDCEHTAIVGAIRYAPPLAYWDEYHRADAAADRAVAFAEELVA